MLFLSEAPVFSPIKQELCCPRPLPPSKTTGALTLSSILSRAWAPSFRFVRSWGPFSRKRRTFSGNTGRSLLGQTLGLRRKESRAGLEKKQDSQPAQGPSDVLTLGCRGLSALASQQGGSRTRHPLPPQRPGGCGGIRHLSAFPQGLYLLQSQAPSSLGVQGLGPTSRWVQRRSFGTTPSHTHTPFESHPNLPIPAPGGLHKALLHARERPARSLPEPSRVITTANSTGGALAHKDLILTPTRGG